MGLGSSAIVVSIGGPVAVADIPGLCERLCALLERTDVRVVVCDLGDLVEPGLATVDALARLVLTARQYGAEVCLRHVSSELEELLSFTGLGTCSETLVFAPDVPRSRKSSGAPMNPRTPRSRTGENAPEEDPS